MAQIETSEINWNNNTVLSDLKLFKNKMRWESMQSHTFYATSDCTSDVRVLNNFVSQEIKCWKVCWTFTRKEKSEATRCQVLFSSMNISTVINRCLIQQCLTNAFLLYFSVSSDQLNIVLINVSAQNEMMIIFCQSHGCYNFQVFACSIHKIFYLFWT